MKIDDLTRCAIRNGTDKFGYHDYTPKYYRALKHLQNSDINLLEIGVGGYMDPMRGGESLEAWRDFFPNGRIIGFDLHAKTRNLGPRITVERGSQIDLDFLDSLVEKYGPYEVIVDDGSHECAHVGITFDHLFPALLPGGVFIVEDMQTAFNKNFGGSFELTKPNHVGHFADIAMAMWLDKPDVVSFVNDIHSMERFHSIVMLRKTGGVTSGQSSQAQIVANREDPAAPRILVLGGESSAWSGLGSVVTGDASTMNVSGYDIIVDAAGEGAKDRFEARFPTLDTGASYVVATPDPSSEPYFHRLFADLDHVGIKGFYPNAKISPFADQVTSIDAYPAMIALRKGDNSYPSTFNFDSQNHLFQENQKIIEQVLSEGANPRGYIHHALLAMRVKNDGLMGMALDNAGKDGIDDVDEVEFFTLSIQRAFKQKDFKKAITIGDVGIAKFPNDPNLLRLYAQCLAQEGENDRAADCLRKAISIEPKLTMLHRLLIPILYKTGQQAEAFQLANDLKRLAPRHPWSWFLAAEAETKAGDAEAAIESAKKACELRPDWPAAYAILSKAYKMAGKPEEAQAAITEGLSHAPNNSTLLKMK